MTVEDPLISRPVDLEALAGGHRETIVAGPIERERLAEGLRLQEVRRFEAQLEGRRWRRDGAEVTGWVRGEIVQPCVVTLEPVVQSIDEAIAVRLLPASGKHADDEEEVFVDAEGEDPPDRVQGRTVDLGALAAEFFAIGIDPYPRVPEAELAAVLPPASEATEDSPFAALADLVASEGKAKGKRG